MFTRPDYTELLSMSGLIYRYNIFEISCSRLRNKAGYTATPVVCGWAGAIIEVSGTFGQEQ